MSETAAIRLVATREFTSRMRARSTTVSMAVMVALIVIGGVVGNYFLDRSAEPQATVLALTERTAPLREPLEAAATQSGMDVLLVEVPEEDARRALTEDDVDHLDEPLDAAVVGRAEAPIVLTTNPLPDQTLMSTVALAAQNLVLGNLVSELGGDPASFGTALAQASPQLEVLTEEGGFDGPRYLVAMIATSFLLFALILTGVAISTGVVEEKSSRVVELLLATIKPAQLLAGKVLGIGLYGLIQVLLLGGVTTGTALALGLLEDVDVDVGATLVWLIAWFLVGYLTFALLWGGFSSLVSRQEDIGAVTTPLTFLMLIPFYVSIYLVPNSPDGAVTNALSYVPFLAPFLMPVRQAFGVVSAGEMLVALAISAALIPVWVWVAGRVYARGVLHTGGRMRLAEALRG